MRIPRTLTAPKTLAVVLTLAATALPAQEPVLLSAEDHAAWQAIGRLNVLGYNRRKMCTATLIAPDVVLSAAHCVLYADGRAIPAEQLRFVSGWFRGDYAAVAEVARIDGASRFQAAVQQGDIAIAADSVRLTLTAPIDGVPSIPQAVPQATAPVRILGYRWDRPHALSDTGTCEVQTLPDARLQMTCPATFGNSGGPVLQQQDGQWHVVGVVSAIGGGKTFGAPLP